MSAAWVLALLGGLSGLVGGTAALLPKGRRTRRVIVLVFFVVEIAISIVAYALANNDTHAYFRLMGVGLGATFVVATVMMLIISWYDYNKRKRARGQQ